MTDTVNTGTTPPKPIATLERAYRVAVRASEAHDKDMQVAATGKPERPFIAEPASERRRGVVARIVADRR